MSEIPDAVDAPLDWVPALRQTRNGLVRMLSETEKALDSQDSARARAALGLLEDIDEQCQQMTERAVTTAKNGDESTEKGIWRVRIAGNAGRLAREVAGVAEIAINKIEGRVLFSDKANNELRPLFAFVRKALGDVFDGIETGNQTLLIAVISTSEKIASESNAAATEHEERLVQGLCRPKASALFLDLIYSLRGISHTLKTLVRDVPERES